MTRTQLALAFALLSSLPLLAQQTPPVEETVTVNVVTLDATVTDRDGNPILGLAPDDFVVEEDGRPVEVESVDYFTSRRMIDRPEKGAPFNVERLREERYFVILFHKEGGDAYQGFYGELLRAKNAARKFVDKQMLANDRVAVAGYDVRLKIFSDFTGDKDQLRRALDEAITFANGISDKPAATDAPEIFDALDVKEMINDTGSVFEGLEVLADALRPIRGRKMLVLFSAGMGDPSRFDPIFIEDESREYNPMVEALQSANVTVFSVNLLRLVTQYRSREELLGRLASDTGGNYYRNLTGFEVAFKEADRSNAGYYLLTYTMPRHEAKEGFQKVTVRLRNPEFKVTARKGYVYP
jgi:VWFA-related protein